MSRPVGDDSRSRGRAEANRAVDSARARTPTGGLLTAAQVAELLGVPQTWVYAQSRSGRIPTVTLGRYRRYRREAIEAWLQELESSVYVRAGTR